MRESRRDLHLGQRAANVVAAISGWADRVNGCGQVPGNSTSHNPASHTAFQHVSALEDSYGQFFESTIAAAARAHSGADRLMEHAALVEQARNVAEVSPARPDPASRCA